MYFFTIYGNDNAFEHYKMLYNTNEQTFHDLYNDVDIIVPTNTCVVPIDEVFKLDNITYRTIEKYIGCKMEVFNPIKNTNEIKKLFAVIVEYDKGRKAMKIDGIQFGKIKPRTSYRLFFVNSLDNSIDSLNFNFYEISISESFEIEGKTDVVFNNNIINNGNIDTIEYMNYISSPRFNILHSRESRWSGTSNRVSTIRAHSKNKNKPSKRNTSNKKNKTNKKNRSSKKNTSSKKNKSTK